MNNTMINLMKKELKRLEKAYERAKENTKNCREAPSKYLELHQEAIKILNDESLELSEKLEKFDEMKKQSEKLRKLMDQDYCKLVEKEVKLLMQLEEIQRNINDSEFEARMTTKWDRAFGSMQRSLNGTPKN